MKYRMEQRKETISLIRQRLKQFGTLCSISLFAYLGAAVFVMLLIAPELLQQVSTRSSALFIITPSVVPILILSGGALVLFSIMLILAILISYCFSLGESFIPSVKELFFGAPGKHSTILTIGGLFFAVLILNVIYYFLVESSGADPTVPDFESDPLWMMVYGFARASVWEEIITRVLLIGVPLLWIDLLFRRTQMLALAKYFVGGGMKFGVVECALILFSALMFGFGHLQGWDVWKVVPTVITGLAFGYLFVRIGLYAAIVFHFAFDFLDVPLRYLNAESSLEFSLLFLLWLGAGIMFFVYYAWKFGMFLRRSMFKTKPEQTA